jgi:hypothetical protein
MVLLTTLVLSTVLFGGLGITVDQMIKRRQFYRRNRAGVEEFRSYGSKVAINAYEGMLGFLSRLCLFAGCICAVASTLVWLAERHIIDVSDVDLPTFSGLFSVGQERGVADQTIRMDLGTNNQERHTPGQGSDRAHSRR